MLVRNWCLNACTQCCLGLCSEHRQQTDDNKLNTLLEIAWKHIAESVQFDAAVFQSKGLLTEGKIAEQGCQLYQQKTWSKTAYQQALLESLKSIVGAGGGSSGFLMIS